MDPSYALRRSRLSGSQSLGVDILLYSVHVLGKDSLLLCFGLLDTVQDELTSAPKFRISLTQFDIVFVHYSSSVHVVGLQSTKGFLVLVECFKFGVEIHQAVFEYGEIIVACCQQVLPILGPMGCILVLFAIVTATWREYSILDDMVVTTEWYLMSKSVDRAFSYGPTRVATWMQGVSMVTHTVELCVRDENGKHS